jgi:hypothetical protein
MFNANSTRNWVRFQVLTEASAKITGLWNLGPCSLVEIDVSEVRTASIIRAEVCNLNTEACLLQNQSSPCFIFRVSSRAIPTSTLKSSYSTSAFMGTCSNSGVLANQLHQLTAPGDDVGSPDRTLNTTASFKFHSYSPFMSTCRSNTTPWSLCCTTEI